MKQLEDYCLITRLLIEQGAETGKAIEYATERYGPIEEISAECPRQADIKKVLLIIGLHFSLATNYGNMKKVCRSTYAQDRNESNVCKGLEPSR
jgi:hypothetical protein